MKGKILKVLLNVFLYLIFALLWCAILFVLTLLRVFDTFLDRFADGALLTIFACIAIAGIIITILFRKRMKHKWMMPLCLIIATIITTSINWCILDCSSKYMSVYTEEKWDKYPSVRYCMLDSLNEQYEFIDMPEEELKETLGEPDNVIERDDYNIYQYTIGDDYIDGYYYDFIIKDDRVSETAFSQS